jgi:hypothetical protein
MPSTKPHLTVANVATRLALFISLGGVSWAAVTLPKGSVGSRQLQANAVGTQNVRDRTIRSGRRARPGGGPRLGVRNGRAEHSRRSQPHLE